MQQRPQGFDLGGAQATRLNPVTYIVAAERALFAGDLAAPAVRYGAAAAVGTAALGLYLGARAMRRASL